MENLNLENELLNEANPLKDVLFIVLLNREENFGVRAPYDLEILGKKMWEWVALCGSGAKIKTTPCTNESNVINLIKPFVGTEKVTMVFYSDTPLLSRESVIEILEHFASKGQNVLKLKRGFVFDSEYLKNCENILAEEDLMFDSPEFEKVDSYEKLANVGEILKNSIINFHMKNGVYIVDPKTTYIEADVVIEKGVKIEQNNVIKGNSYIGESCVLEPNNTIINSIISKNVVVKNSYISNSGISENMIVGPFETVIDKNC